MYSFLLHMEVEWVYEISLLDIEYNRDLQH